MTTLGYIVVYIFNYKMFHQEASVETIKMIVSNALVIQMGTGEGILFQDE